MHLSALRLHGFKSFATVTELKFRPGLTAIVGPNGSGKSNIADAVRWVLGEQSIRALRGTRSQDIIFSGNGRRRPLGLAQVTLELNNEDGLFPLNFSQVSIARKVHRTGEGEFAINGTPCRLRDIHELLTDTGLGRGGFFVVSQGEIDAVLSARPEDRRLLLEEVAGTAGYRMRRKQALDRLEVARADRRRVLDLLDELHRQGDDLRIQSEEAQRYTALKERLRDVEQRLVRAGWRRWLPAWHKALAELENAQRDLVAGEEELAARERAYEEAAARKEAAEARLLELTDAVHEAERSVAEARHRLEVGGLRLQQLERDDGRLQQRLEEIDGQRAEAEAEAHQAEDALQRVNREVEEVTRQVAELHRRYSGQERELQADEERLEALRAEEMNHRQELLRVQEGIAGLQSRLRGLEEQRQRHEAEWEHWRAEYGQWEADVAEAREAAAALEAEAQDLEQAIRRLEKERTARQEQLTALQQKVRALQREHDADDARRRALEAMETSGEGYQQGVRRVMARRDLRQRGIIGPVGQLLDVEPRWQTAVETALGAAIQNIVARDGEAVKAAIDYLKKERAGRATFLPLDRLRIGPVPRGVEDVLREEGVFGFAHRLVGVRPGAEKAVEYVLGRTLVVSTLDVAMDIARRLPASVRLVTLDGEMVIPGGAVSGGYGERPGRRGGLLARRRALRELAEGMAAREKELDGLRRDVEAAAAAAEETEATWRETDQRRQKVQAEKTMWQRRIQELRRMEERLLARGRRLEEEQARIAGEGDKLTARLGEWEASRAELEAAGEQLTAQLHHQAQKVEEARRFFQDALPDLHGAQARLAALQQEQSHREGERKRCDAVLERLARQRLDVEEQRLALAQERRRLIQEHEEQKTRLAEGERLLEERKALRQEAEAADQRLREEVKTAERAVAEARKEGAKLQQNVHRWETQWQRAEHELANLRERAAALDIDPEVDTAVSPELTAEGDLDPTDSSPEETEDPGALQREAKTLRAQLERMPAVNLAAPEQLARLQERVKELTGQAADLEEAEEGIQAAIAEIDAAAGKTFMDVFAKVQDALEDVFGELFPGGHCRLSLTDEDDPLRGGVDVHVQLPGKPSRHLLALSGGERALTALALIFALMRVRPAPFCVLDEVDASLDEANLHRFTRLLRATADRSQVIAITHRRPTMEAADSLYGVTMKEPGVSSLVSLQLEEVG